MMRLTRHHWLGAAGLTAALLLSASAASADDTDLFTARVAPNVMFVVDNSGSMNNVVWHDEYVPGAYYDPIGCPFNADKTDPMYNPLCLKHPLCPISYGQGGFDTGGNEYWSNIPDNTFRMRNDRGNVSPGGGACNTRYLFNDQDVDDAGDYTRWQLEYMRWYFSDNTDEDPDSDGDSIYVEILKTNNGITSACLLAQDPMRPATYGKYRRSRVTATKNVLRDVICETSAVADIRYGLAKFYSSGDPAGGYVRLAIDDYTPTHANDLEAKIDALTGDGWTPLSETLYNVYRYYQSRASSEQAMGKNGTTRFPVYNIQENGSTGGTIPPSPVTDDCQKHFVILITDGEPTRDDFDGMDLARFQNELIGDYYTTDDATNEPQGELVPNNFFAPVMDSGSCWGDPMDPMEDSCESSLYLDDITAFMANNDFQLDAAFPDTQLIESYMVGFSTSGAANDLLRRAADTGNGEFYTSANPDELTENVTNAINSIVAKAQSFTSAAVPASRTTNGDNFYTSFFLPAPNDPLWEGHLKNFEFSASGEILTPSGTCAIGPDPTALPPCATQGGLRTSATGFWDAATEMPLPDDRNLYVEFGDTNIFDMPDTFVYSNVDEDDFNIVDNVDEFDPPYDTLSPDDPDDIAQALIDLLRGCEFDSSPCTPRVDASGAARYLGDIFHSNPLVVGSPNSPINEPTYKSFANTYRERTRVIYAGSNGGFLHGFNSGDWDSLAVPPRHDRGTGEELFGFMPYWARNVIKDLPKELGSLRTMVTVDGSPVSADAWFYRNESSGNLGSVNATLTLADKTAPQWRTVLLAGMRDGGEQYYALDITDPTQSASDVTTDYPRYLWGFPCEDCSNAENGSTSGEGTYMGLTWSEPVITRVRVKGDPPDLKTYERWVAVFGGGYHEYGDPNRAEYKDPGDAGFQPKGRAIFMVDITTGEVLAKKYFDDGASALSTTPTADVKEMRYAIASSPAVFDLNFDGFADVIYIGDLGGQLWKWVVKAPGQDPINNSSGEDDIDQPDWPFRRFFRAGTSLEPTLPGEQSGGVHSPAVHYQSLFFPPTGAIRQGKLILGFGAGERQNPIGPAALYNDAVLANNNHFYVVKDEDALELTSPAPNPLTDSFDEADLADFDAPMPLTCAQMQATKSGYYITGRDAEKFITNSIVFLGKIFMGSFLPNDPLSANKCDGAGEAFLYSFDLDCGVGAFPTAPGSDQDDRRKQIGTGIPTRPRVSVGGLNQGGGGGGCENKVVVITSDGNIDNDCPGPLPSSGVQLKSWRER